MKLSNILNILIVIFITIYKINGDVCQSCLKLNDTCTGKFEKIDPVTNVTSQVYETIGQCSNGLICAPANTRVTIGYKVNWVCRNYALEGQSCYNQLECDMGLLCDDQKICVLGNFTQVGGNCKSDTDCAGYFTRCLNDKCNNEEGSCYTNDDCVFEKQCDTTVNACKPTLQRGDSCDTNNSLCFQDLECLPTGVCGSPELKQLGETCKSENNECDSSKSLYCSKDLKCEQFIIPTTCSDDHKVGNEQCGEYYSCACSTGKCNQAKPLPYENTQYNSLIKCAYDNKCQMITNIANPESCVFQKCSNELCAYKSLFYKSENNLCNNTYVIDHFCNYVPNNSNSIMKNISMISSLILVVLIALLI